MRKARFDLISAEGDICRLLFDHSKTQTAARLFLEWLKKRGCRVTKHEMSRFAHDLQAGRIKRGFRYRRENFYRLILKRMRNLGPISLQTRLDSLKGRSVQVYEPVRQHIPKRGPPKGSFWHNAYVICKKWNEEFKKLSLKAN